MKTSTESRQWVLDRNLRFILRKNQVPASAVARDAQISRKTLQNWLTGQRPKSIEQFYRLADVLGFSIEDLCFGDLKEAQRPMNSVLLEGCYEVIIRVPHSALSGLPRTSIK